MSSEDSDTVLLNATTDKDEASDPDPPPKPAPLSRSSTFGYKKCWICIGDSSEDDPIKPPVWRSPCSCNLTAHEDCLLDWVADLENPRKDKSRLSSKILCPQCKSEIKVSRPTSYVVEATKAADRVLSNLVLPGLGLGLFGTLWAGSWWHGFHAVQMVFGNRDAAHILQEAAKHPGWMSMYALVPINLIFARTDYREFVLPSGSLFLLSTQLSDGWAIDMTIYPPLPSTVFICLPATLKGYNYLYNKAFGNLNKKWLDEIQPKEIGRVEEGQEQNEADFANQEHDENVVLQLEVNLGGAADNANDGQNQNNDQGPQHADGQNGNGANQGENANNQAGQNGNGNGGGLAARGGEIIDASSTIGTTLIGALAFPAVASGMGELLSYCIPKAWMADANFINGRPGLLKNKWGRSVVEGCLFVVLKDALVLYCRWRMAKNHRHRKIMDYDKTAKKYVVS